MDRRKRIVESLSSSWKARIDLYLREEGYVTYADRLTYFKFIIADVYHGSHIEVAAMFPDSAEIVINPAFVNEKNFGGNTKKMMDQLSLLVRHELLHFLLVHEQRLIDHMEKKYPGWKRKFGEYSIRQLDNYAADWDLSKEGYDDHDKEVARLMSVNNRVLGGLILSDNHPEWIDLTYEEILDKLIEENVKQMEETRQQLKKQLQQKKQQSQDQGSNTNNIDDTTTSQNGLSLDLFGSGSIEDEDDQDSQDQSGQSGQVQSGQGGQGQSGQGGQQGQPDQNGQSGQLGLNGQQDQSGQHDQSDEQGDQNSQSGQSGQQGQDGQQGQSGQSGQSNQQGQGSQSQSGQSGQGQSGQDSQGQSGQVQSGQSSKGNKNNNISGQTTNTGGDQTQEDGTDDKDGNIQGQSRQGNGEDDDESFEDLEQRAYASAWNEILDRFDRDEIKDDELVQLLNDIESGKIDSI